MEMLPVAAKIKREIYLKIPINPPRHEGIGGKWSRFCV